LFKQYYSVHNKHLFIKTKVFVINWFQWHKKWQHLFRGALYNKWKCKKRATPLGLIGLKVKFDWSKSSPHLFSYSWPLVGQVDHGSGVHEAVAKLVAEVAPDPVDRPAVFQLKWRRVGG
jgi:hypothetical protein